MFRRVLSFAILANVTGLTTTISPWSPSSWKLSLDVGRESGTEMPKAWGESGARLVLPIEVTVSSDESNLRDNLVGSGSLSIRPEKDACFINLSGEQRVSVKEGGWSFEYPKGGKGHAAKLQFWLDLDSPSSRNDVTLPVGRLYFIANCWRQDELEIGSRLIAPLVYDAREAQKLVEDRVSHEGGDRRLDGTDPIETMLGYKDIAALILDRDNKIQKLRDAEKIFGPSNTDSMAMGAWPGSIEPLAIAPAKLMMAKKKLFGTELVTIGRWKAKPINCR